MTSASVCENKGSHTEAFILKIPVMKYDKSNITESLSSMKLRVVVLDVEDSPRDKSWARITRDGKHAILQNNPSTFDPYISYGTVWKLEGSRIRLDSFLISVKSFTLHPEEWDRAVKNGVIDEEGNILRTMKS